MSSSWAALGQLREQRAFFCAPLCRLWLAACSHTTNVHERKTEINSLLLLALRLTNEARTIFPGLCKFAVEQMSHNGGGRLAVRAHCSSCRKSSSCRMTYYTCWLVSNLSQAKDRCDTVRPPPRLVFCVSIQQQSRGQVGRLQVLQPRLFFLLLGRPAAAASPPF